MELSLLCDCEIALIIFEGPPQNKVIEYGSKSIDETLKLFATNGSPNQAVTNEDYKYMFGSEKGKPRARPAASSVSASKAAASTNAANSEGETKLYKFTNGQVNESAAQVMNMPAGAMPTPMMHQPPPPHIMNLPQSNALGYFLPPLPHGMQDFGSGQTKLGSSRMELTHTQDGTKFAPMPHQKSNGTVATPYSFQTIGDYQDVGAVSQSRGLAYNPAVLQQLAYQNAQNLAVQQQMAIVQERIRQGAQFHAFQNSSQYAYLQNGGMYGALASLKPNGLVVGALDKTPFVPSKQVNNRYAFLNQPQSAAKAALQLKNHPSSYMQHEMRQHEVTMAGGEPVSRDRISALAKEVVVGAKSSK